MDQPIFTSPEEERNIECRKLLMLITKTTKEADSLSRLIMSTTDKNLLEHYRYIKDCVDQELRSYCLQHRDLLTR